MEPKFSIIIPVYNAAATLEIAVESIAAQQGADWECILVNDGSTDGSPALCDRLAARFPWVRAFHTPNGGPSAARNRGMEEAAGTWLLFLDSDDQLAPDGLAQLRLWLERCPDSPWLVCDYRNLTPEGVLKPPVRGWQQPETITGATFAQRAERFRKIDSMAVWQYCLRRSWVVESGIRFAPGIHWAEDKLFSLLLLGKAEQVTLVPVVLLYYHCDRPGGLANSNVLRHLEGAAAVWQLLDAAYPDPADNRAARELAAEVFWPAARAAAGLDRGGRAACLPAIRQARPLWVKCSQSVGSPSWVLFRWMLCLLGANMALELASRLHHH